MARSHAASAGTTRVKRILEIRIGVIASSASSPVRESTLAKYSSTRSSLNAS